MAEPNLKDAVSILRGIKDKYELHHGVQIKDEAIILAVELSSRYITDPLSFKLEVIDYQ